MDNSTNIRKIITDVPNTTHKKFEKNNIKINYMMYTVFTVDHNVYNFISGDIEGESQDQVINKMINFIKKLQEGAEKLPFSSNNIKLQNILNQSILEIENKVNRINNVAVVFGLVVDNKNHIDFSIRTPYEISIHDLLDSLIIDLKREQGNKSSIFANPLTKFEKYALYGGFYILGVGLLYSIFKSKPALAASPKPNEIDAGHYEPSPTLNPGNDYLIASVAPNGSSTNFTDVFNTLKSQGWQNISFLFFPGNHVNQWPLNLPKPNESLMSIMYVFEGTWNGLPNTTVDPHVTMMPLKWVPASPKG